MVPRIGVTRLAHSLWALTATYRPLLSRMFRVLGDLKMRYLIVERVMLYWRRHLGVGREKVGERLSGRQSVSFAGGAWRLAA